MVVPSNILQSGCYFFWTIRIFLFVEINQEPAIERRRFLIKIDRKMKVSKFDPGNFRKAKDRFFLWRRIEQTAKIIVVQERFGETDPAEGNFNGNKSQSPFEPVFYHKTSECVSSLFIISLMKTGPNWLNSDVNPFTNENFFLVLF